MFTAKLSGITSKFTTMNGGYVNTNVGSKFTHQNGPKKGQEEWEHLDVSFSGDLAKQWVATVQPGMLVEIEGNIHVRRYRDAAGNDQKQVKVYAKSFTVINKKTEGKPAEPAQTITNVAGVPGLNGEQFDALAALLRAAVAA